MAISQCCFGWSRFGSPIVVETFDVFSWATLFSRKVVKCVRVRLKIKSHSTSSQMTLRSRSLLCVGFRGVILGWRRVTVLRMLNSFLSERRFSDTVREWNSARCWLTCLRVVFAANRDVCDCVLQGITRLISGTVDYKGSVAKVLVVGAARPKLLVVVASRALILGATRPK